MEGRKRSIIKTDPQVTEQQPVLKKALLTYTSTVRVFSTEEEVEHVDTHTITKQVDGPKPQLVVLEEIMAWTIHKKGRENAPFTTKAAIQSILEKHGLSNSSDGINKVLGLVVNHYSEITAKGKSVMLPSTVNLNKAHILNLSFVSICLKQIQEGIATATVPNADTECEKVVARVVNPPAVQPDMKGMCSFIALGENTKNNKPMLSAMGYEFHSLHGRIVALGRNETLEYAGRVLGPQHRQTVECMVMAVHKAWKE